MAKIHGIELKGIKTFLDHEGAPIAQGNIYVEGKKVAEWSQDSWGGCDIFRMCDGYDERAFYDAIKRVHPETHKFKTYGEEFELDYNADILMHDLLNLNEEEKEYKKLVKNGYTAFCSIDDGYRNVGFGIRSSNGLTDSLKERLVSEGKKRGMSADSIKITYRGSLDDFIIGKPIRLADIKRKAV